MTPSTVAVYLVFAASLDEGLSVAVRVTHADTTLGDQITCSEHQHLSG